MRVTLNTLSEIDLLTLLNEGDTSAFTEIYCRYREKLTIVARSKTKSASDAEEIVQELFLDLWARRGKLKIKGRLSAYLAVSVNYRVINVLKGRFHKLNYAAFTRQSSSLLDNSTQEWIEYVQLRSHVNGIIHSLPRKCRLAYQLSRNFGYSQQQIADQLNISRKTVETHISKALKSLRAGLPPLYLISFKKYLRPH